MDFHSLTRRDLQFLCKKNGVPANLTNVAMAKSLEALEMVKGTEEIQEALGLELPQILSKTPATRKAANGVEAQSSRRKAKKNEEAESHAETPMVAEARGGKAAGVVIRRSARLSSRKELEVSVTTQSKIRIRSRENSAVKMEALAKEEKDLVEYGDSCPRLRRVISKKEDDIKDQKVLPNARRSTRLPSRNPAEEMSIEEGTDKMEVLIEEDVEEQEKEKEEKDIAERSDSCVVVLVEDEEKKDKKEESNGDLTDVPVKGDKKNDQELEIQGFSSSFEESHSFSGGNSKVEVDEQFEFIGDEEKDKKEESHGYSSSSFEFEVAHVKEDEKNDQELEIQTFSSSFERLNLDVNQKDDVEIHGYSSSIEVENGHSTVVHVKGDSYNYQQLEIQAFSSSMADEEKDKKEENHGYSSYIEVENGDSTVVHGKEDEKNNQEVEIQAFSSSFERHNPDVNQKDDVEIHGYSSSIEVEINDSTIVHVKEDEKKDQELEIQAFSSSMAEEEKDKKEENHGYSSSIEVENGDSTVVHVKEDEKNNQEVEIQAFSSSFERHNPDVNQKDDVEIHGYSSSIEVENKDSTIVKEDEKNDQELEIQAFSSSDVKLSNSSHSDNLPQEEDCLLNSDELSSEKSVNAEASEPHIIATEIAEEKVCLDNKNLQLLSLTKLKAIYKQMLNDTKTKNEVLQKQQQMKSIAEQACIKQDENCNQKLNEDMTKLESEKSLINKHDSNCKHKLNDDVIKSERKKSLIKQHLECLSSTKKFNDDAIKSERKRTPLKNLNYSTF